MSSPKFTKLAERVDMELGLEPLASPWDRDYQREAAERFRASLPATVQPYVDLDANVARRLGRLCHNAFLRRTGGMRNNWADEVHLMWGCCGREELLAEVNYDRRGNLRPEDQARILGLSYYHRCTDA